MSFSVSRVYTFDPDNAVIGGTMVEVPVNSDWTAEGPNAPESAVENGDLVYLFSSGLAQQLTMFMKVPQAYVVQKQLTMYVNFYTASTSGTVLFRALTTLIRRSSDAITSTTNQYTSTNSAVTNSVTSNKYNQVAIDLTDSGGLINSTTVLPGDLIRITLYRDTDTDTAVVRLLANSTEVVQAS